MSKLKNFLSTELNPSEIGCIIICILLFIFMSAFRSNSITKPYIYIDEDTGVNYLVYSVGYKAGMSVRYNSDGSLYITDLEENNDSQ